MPLDKEEKAALELISEQPECDAAIFTLHGINTPPDVPYVGEWQEALGPGFEPGEVLFVEGRWESTGTVMGDVFKIMLKKKKREAAVDALVEQLENFLALPHRHKLLLAHSMGEPLLCAAVRKLQCELPIITIGGPMSNPLFGNAMATVGLRSPTPGAKPIRFWNRHDGVCCSRFLGARQPAWMESIRIAVAGDTGWIVEHDATLYLENLNTRSAVRYVLEIV